MDERIKTWLAALEDRKHCDEYEAKTLLQSFDIKTSAGQRFSPDIDTGIIGSQIAESAVFPVVLKVCSAGIIHKTDSGGVILNIGKESLAEKLSLLRSRFPGEAILAETMINGTGAELIAGALNDPDFGPSVMLGAGGILTELYRDTAWRIAPFDKKEAFHMMEELKLSPLFNGFRGIKLDRESLASLLEKLGDIACALGPVFTQIDLNPVVFDCKDWVVLDAKIALKD